MKEKVKVYAPYSIIALLCLFIVFWVFKGNNDEKASVYTQQQLTNTQELTKKANVPEKTAEKIIVEIDNAQNREPDATFYIKSDNLNTAAKDVADKINKNDASLPKVATEDSDKTIVTANDDKQKVDVYKINLAKEHKIKAGATIVDDKSYLSVGYQAGRVEGIVHTDLKEIKGATVMYTVKEW